MPKISVIVPVYNVGRYLERCLDSVINQTFSDIEIICINDGSTDKSAEILAEYAKKDKRIKIISQENQGLSMARNKGISVAKADYITFIDSDDVVCPQFLEILYSTITKSNCDVAGCDFIKVYDAMKWAPIAKSKAKIYKSALNVLLNKRNFIHFNVWNKIYKKSALGDIRFIPDIYYEDWVFNCCVFARINSFAWINQKLYGYRVSDTSIMRSDFNLKKLEDYVTGIKCVAEFYKKNYPHQWEKVKSSRISRTVKMMMNSALRSHNEELPVQTSIVLKQLKNTGLITYKGLSLANKIKLYCFLSRGK